MNLNQTETLTMEEAAEKYPRQWIGVRVVERDAESGQPTKMQILFRNVDVNTVRREIGLDDVCTLWTGPVPETGVVLML
jgi:hypothetical protein